ncbi:MAG: carboxypeptidase regulatory-like domain-containing protein [Methanobacteriota archaeon]
MRGYDRRRTVSRCLVGVSVALLVLGGLASSLARAEASGVFAPPHADVGVDTNGDRLFNVLRVEASVQVVSAGTFTILVVLYDDLDVAPLTQAAVSIALGTGPQRVAVLLDGPDIYNGGVDGPYFAHLTLSSLGGTILSTDVHQTAAYRFTDFQAYAARIVPPASERALDNDTDQLTDWIDLQFTLDISTSDTYTLSSLLTDATYTVSLAPSRTATLGPGRTTLHQLFEGYPLRLAARSGPYLVTNTLYDSRGNRVDFLFVETAAYAYSAFEQPPVLLAPPHAERAVDSDGDALYNSLQIEVRLDAQAFGTATLRGRLVAGDGRLLRDTVVRVNAVPGPQTALLAIEGAAVYASGVDGPYRVELELYDGALRRLDSGILWTAAYSHLAFEPHILYLDPPFLDSGVDADGNGRFESLQVTVPMDVQIAAYVRIEASLRQGLSSVEIARSTQAVDLPAGSIEVAFGFAGAAIVASGIDGPYRVWVSAFDAQGTLIDEGNERTGSYLVTEFEGAPIARVLGLLQEAPEDVDADGVFNRLRIRIQVDASTAGRYRAEGTLLQGGAVVAETMSTSTLPAGTSTMDVVFGGPDIRASGRDGPYDLRVTLWSSGGTAPLATATLATAAYAASAFEAASPASLSGRIVSDFAGTPLEGATVWAIDYANQVSRRTATDAGGAFFVILPSGTYWIVVDHPGRQAEAWSQAVLGNAYAGASLGFPRRNLLESDLTWTGWDRLLVAVRYVYATDAPATPFQLDWVSGNRDGRVDASEYALLPLPSDPIRDLIDAGTTSDRVGVNGIRYDAIGPPSWTDGVSGDVAVGGLPYFRVARAFASSWNIGEPPRAEVALQTLLDTAALDRRTRLYLPNAYRYARSTDDPDIAFMGRKLPYVVDPDLPGDGSAGDSRTFEVLLFRQASYVPPTPSAPSAVVATPMGPSVSLAWRRPTTNVDGTPLANLAGYHVYRRYGAEATYTRISGQIVTAEAFVDGSLPGIGTLYYGVTSVNTDGVEGGLSPPAVATIAGFALSISVVDGTGDGLAGARVDLRGAAVGTVASDVTDARGLARLEAPAGEYDLVVSAPDILTATVPVVHLADGSVVVTVQRRSAIPPALALALAGMGSFVAITVVVAALRFRRGRTSHATGQPAQSPWNQVR